MDPKFASSNHSIREPLGGKVSLATKREQKGAKQAI